jgi:hypothetical protein
MHMTNLESGRGEKSTMSITTNAHRCPRGSSDNTTFVMDYKCTAFDNISMETYDFQDRLKVKKGNAGRKRL